jgi:hypothetical protein
MDRKSGAEDNDARDFPGVPNWNSGGTGKRKQLRGGLIGTMRYIWVRGPEIPDESEQAAELTPEDQWELTLDHIGRTSDLVANLRIVKVG